MICMEKENLVQLESRIKYKVILANKIKSQSHFVFAVNPPNFTHFPTVDGAEKKRKLGPVPFFFLSPLLSSDEFI